MVWILGMVTMVIVFVLILAIGAAIVLVVIELTVRLVLALALAAGAGVAGGIIAHLAGVDGALTGVLGAVLAFLPALLLVSRWRSAAAAPSASRKPPVIDMSHSLPSDPLERAWATGRKLAPRGA